MPERRRRHPWSLVAVLIASGGLLLVVAALRSPSAAGGVTGTAARARATPSGLVGPRTFTIGFTDPLYGRPGMRPLGQTVAAGGQFVLLSVPWGEIAPRRPRAGTDPGSPSNPAYDWGVFDQSIRGATARGLSVVLTIAGAPGSVPSWAVGPGAPPSTPPGTWRPNPQAFAAFAHAVASRYSGSFRAGGRVLPRVRYYQALSEPNLYNHLNPQWVQAGGKWIAESPIIYRGLLNAFYFAVKSVHQSNQVLTGGTAPWGGKPRGRKYSRRQVAPAVFVRSLLCLQGTQLARLPCPDPAHFDILAHHPYTWAGPYAHALRGDDVQLPDFSKLTRPLKVAERTGRVLPRGAKPVWVTEFSWDTNPPDTLVGVPALRRGYWIEEAFYELWREGVSALAWYFIKDERPVHSVFNSGGLYYVNGKRKAGYEGFRFPFVVEPQRGPRAVVWGISPRAGTVSVERLVSGRWRRFLTFHVHAHAIFKSAILKSALHLATKQSFRAVLNGGSSLVWRLSGGCGRNGCALPGAAPARCVPAGVAGVNQYYEDLPGASCDQSPTSQRTPLLSAATIRQLAALGSVGRAVRQLVASSGTAPQHPTPLAAGSGSSLPISLVRSILTGSGAGSVGILLPLFLTALAGVLVARLYSRRRR